MVAKKITFASITGYYKRPILLNVKVALPLPNWTVVDKRNGRGSNASPTGH
jgi:hypothetical protein